MSAEGFIRKGALEERLYQQELARDAGASNAIIVLPTGMGKTAVAALIIANRLASTGGRTLFLAPTRILVQQHKEFLEKVLDLPAGSVAAVTGEDDIHTRGDAWSAKIVCATPQIAVQDVKRSLLDVSLFDLLILDEVHRAIGDHSYVQISELFRSGDVQRIGLTATLPSERQKIEEIKGHLSAERILFRDYESDDIKPYVHDVKVDVRLLESPDYMKRASLLIREVLKEKLANIARENLMPRAAADKLSFKEMMRNRDSIMAKGSWNAKLSYFFAAKLFNLEKMLETQSYKAFLSYFERVRDTKGRVNSMIVKEPRLKEAYELINGAVVAGLEQPKFEALKGLIAELTPQDRALIFAGYRETVDYIYRTLSDRGISAWILIGKQGATGQRQEEQVKAVDMFRKGKYRVLIATQIGEEGLDIAECNLVVFYDNVASAIRYVQRRGRTGRRKEGRMIMLIVKDTVDEAYYRVVQRKLKSLSTYVRQLASAEPTTGSRPPAKKKGLDSFIG
ncbi:MAG TPA: DEAD/DEAH box helicase [Conexivisphaerales archaeon]|nr:DEAD/DEAH box helicase [Conexivisphaerales archaeon]